MDVNSDDVNGARPPLSDRTERTAARRDGRDLQGGDIRAHLQQVTVRQQRFERFLADELDVDRAGLEAMDHLLSTGTATPTELARRLGVSTAAMTLVLNRLEAAGHVSRDRHPSDGRKLIVTASHESSERAHDSVLPLIDGVEALIESLTAAERATIESFLERLIAVYDRSTPRRTGSEG